MVERGDGWELRLGDCVTEMASVDAECVDYSIFSPPFASLYTYTDDPRDMGNCTGKDEFLAHFAFLAKELERVTLSGRLASFHCMLLPTSKARDGVIGLYDFRGDLIRVMEAVGFVFHSEVVIWKDPVTAMQRTKALGLLHKQIRKDSAMSRQGIPDYVVTMRKLGENPKPITHGPEFPVSLWQKWASPIWTDINPSDTLQYMSARSEEDERHICPLQLEVITRCLGLWSNPGDLVLSPFAGIASEGVQSVRWGRRYLGVELKESYFVQAVANMQNAVAEKDQLRLFA
jgi:DNA modification methylase